MAFKDLTIACRAEQQPAASSRAEQWTIEREPRQPLGRVCFQVNTEAKVARVVTFELGDDDEEEDLSSFVLAALGARISQFGIRVVLPMEVIYPGSVSSGALRAFMQPRPDHPDRASAD